MPTKSRFTRLDAFTKTVEDARIRTTSGGIVTIISIIVVIYLAWGEWLDYRRIIVHPELIVDKGRGLFFASPGLILAQMICSHCLAGERMEIHMNITFPKLPCELLTLDVMDVSGEQQHGVLHGVKKVRLQPASQGGGVIDITALALSV
jgi:endoplasmic reticulum-Golgi intermediate compartment protein 3